MKTLILLFSFTAIFSSQSFSNGLKESNPKEEDTSMTICFGGKHSEEISMSDLQKPGLYVGFCNDQDSKKYKLIGYTFVYSPKYKDTVNKVNAYFETVDGSLPTEGIREQLKKVKPGDLIIVTDVKFEDSYGKMIKLRGPAMTVIP